MSYNYHTICVEWVTMPTLLSKKLLLRCQRRSKDVAEGPKGALPEARARAGGFRLSGRKMVETVHHPTVNGHFRNQLIEATYHI